MKTNWREIPELNRWLVGKNEGTRAVYLRAFKAYQAFSGKSPSELIKEMEKDLKKPRSQQGIVEQRLGGFYQWLIHDYKSRFGEGLSKKTAATWIGAVMGFYRAFRYRVDPKLSGEFKPYPSKRRFNITPENVVKLLSHAKSLRDKAIILTMFQSGMDPSALCGLKYEQVSKELEEGKVPLCIDLVREKRGVEYFTFLGSEAVEALKDYLRERKRKEGKEPDADSPLFVKEGHQRGKVEGINPKLIQKFFRILAVETGLVTLEEIKREHWNPARPHGLRSAFATQLRAAGANQQDIDFLMGHKLPYGGAYFQKERERLRETYSKAMAALSLVKRPEDIDELERVIEQQAKTIAGLTGRIETLEELAHESHAIFEFLKHQGIIPRYKKARE